MLQQPHVRECVHQQVDVIWDEAHQEDTQHPVDNGEGVPTTAELAAGAMSRVTQHAQHLAITVEQKDSGQQKRP